MDRHYHKDAILHGMFQVFSVFPGLFFLSPFAATLLRVAAAYAFLYIANSIVHDRREIVRERFPIIGHPHIWMVWTSAILIGLIGCLLAVGLYTQVVAIVGMITALKHGIFARRYPSIIPLSRGTYALIFVICASLVITGAGAVAFDLPL